MAGVVVAAVAAIPAYAAPPVTGCCACVIQDHDSQVPAFFCVSPASEGEEIAAQARCEAIPGASLVCVCDATAAEGLTPECRAQLARENVICPSAAPAPLLASPGLGGLAALLGTFGLLALRRRS